MTGMATARFSSAPDDSPVSLRYFPPPEHLRERFGSLYHFVSRGPVFNDTTRADIGQLRFLLTGGGHYRFHDGSTAPTPDVCLLGPTLGATGFHLDHPSVVVGVSLLPLGWLALDWGDASQRIDTASDQSGDEGLAQMLETLRGLDAVEDAIPLLWAFLENRMKPIPPAMARFIAATDGWLADESNPRVEALVAATGLSARQVARLANRLYGCAPKQLARKYRALRCASKIVIDRQPWQELCEDGTFYDQSHFIREIKHFIGLTPHQLMTVPSAIARLTLQRRDMFGKLAEINRIS